MRRDQPTTTPLSPGPSLIERFHTARLLVIGDAMVDHFLWGAAERISPEAPVPVVRIERESMRLGGAANVVNNLVALGAQVRLVAVVGEDAASIRLKKMLEGIGVDPEDLLIETDRPTTEKTRVIAHHQQVVRFDRETRAPIDPPTARSALKKIKEAARWAQAIIVSDYEKGFIVPALMTGVTLEAQRHGLFLAVDPKPRHFPLYKGADIVTPNKAETQAIWGGALSSDADFARAGRGIMKRHQLGAVLITRGEEGMTLCRPDAVDHIPTMAREVYDVTGAGDTVIATLALAVASGAPLDQAALLANLAAGLVVAEVGTSPVKREALASQLQDAQANAQRMRGAKRKK